MILVSVDTLCTAQKQIRILHDTTMVEWLSVPHVHEGANKKLLLDQEGDSSSFEKEQITFRSCDTCFSQGSLAKDSYYHRRSQWILHAEWIKSVGESDEIVSLKRTFQDTDFKEWKLVIQEITKFLKVDTGFMNIRPLIYSLTLDLHPDNLPPVANVKRNLKLGDAILCSYHPNEVKFFGFIWSSFVQGSRRCRGNKRQVLRFDIWVSGNMLWGTYNVNLKMLSHRLGHRSCAITIFLPRILKAFLSEKALEISVHGPANQRSHSYTVMNHLNCIPVGARATMTSIIGDASVQSVPATAGHPWHTHGCSRVGRLDTLLSVLVGSGCLKIIICKWSSYTVVNHLNCIPSMPATAGHPWHTHGCSRVGRLDMLLSVLVGSGCLKIIICKWSSYTVVNHLNCIPVGARAEIAMREADEVGWFSGWVHRVDWFSQWVGSVGASRSFSLGNANCFFAIVDELSFTISFLLFLQLLQVKTIDEITHDVFPKTKVYAIYASIVGTLPDLKEIISDCLFIMGQTPQSHVTIGLGVQKYPDLHPYQRSMEKDPEKKNYPGGTFDPLGYSKDPKTFMAEKVVSSRAMESKRKISANSQLHSKGMLWVNSLFMWVCFADFVTVLTYYKADGTVIECITSAVVWLLPVVWKIKASRDRLEEAVSVLAHQENEIKASRNQIEEAESKLGERLKELNASRDRREEAKICRLKLVESQYKELEAERRILLSKIATLENNVQKERNLLKKAEAKCQQLKMRYRDCNMKFRLQSQSTRITRFPKIKQDQGIGTDYGTVADESARRAIRSGGIREGNPSNCISFCCIWKDGDATSPKENEGVDKGPNLIICPSSVIQNWEDVFSKWSTFSVAIYHGANHDKVSIPENWKILSMTNAICSE
ncbi:hypothetical protein CTI12_AA309280 [Artemisia annua]|uniref:SNF2 N-terminal domain-containing protein n=1 Tax=Artemisia annua TaxID=35608 RepID=A0A2U1N4D1_ARTAN|nr:hypothetical protein CTI12_AA309280 [Artemisia annua]